MFNTIMTRAGITLIVTVAFSISSMFYNISSDYPFFMIAFLQIVCFAGIYMKLGDLMSMFSLNAGDTQHMGRRIFRRPYLFMRHRARRMENRLVRAVGTGSMVGAGTGAMASSVFSNRKNRQTNTDDQKQRTNTSLGSRAGSAVGAVLDTKNKVKDKAKAVKENVKDIPTQTAYAVHSAKEKAKSSVSDFKRGMIQEKESRQTERADKLNQHKATIADKRMALQKAQEARRTGGQGDGSATAGATRPHERPVTASHIKQSQTTPEKKERPVTADNTVHSGQTNTTAVKERPSVSDTIRTEQSTGIKERPLSSREDRQQSVQASQRERVNTARQTATVQQEQRTQTVKTTQQTRQEKKQSRQRKKGRKQ